MPKRATNIFIRTLLIMVVLVFCVEAPDLSGWAYVMACPDSSFLDCDEDNDCILKEGKPYLSNSTFYLTLVGISTFHDQGFVKSIFHPPTFTL